MVQKKLICEFLSLAIFSYKTDAVEQM